MITYSVLSAIIIISIFYLIMGSVWLEFNSWLHDVIRASTPVFTAHVVTANLLMVCWLPIFIWQILMKIMKELYA